MLNSPERTASTKITAKTLMMTAQGHLEHHLINILEIEVYLLKASGC